MNEKTWSEILRDAWSNIKKFYMEHTFAALFLTAMFGGFFAFFIHIKYVAWDGAGSVMDGFFVNGADIFMDFFNSIRDVAQGSGVYTWRNVIYPPMANLILLVYSVFVPKSYSDAIFADRYTWVDHPEAMAAFFACMFIPLFLLLLFCYKQFKAGNRPAGLLALFTIFNMPVLYMLERGNILIYSVIAVLYYIFNYNSESKVQRELALLALAFAFSLKLYPAILGVPLIADKRYKDGVRCAIYALLMLILPSFFFGGLYCFVMILDNVMSFSSGKHTTWTVLLFQHLGEHYEELLICKIFDYLPFVLALGLFLISCFTQKTRWKVWMLGILVLFTFPALNSMYAWSFFLAPLILVINLKKPTSTDFFYFICIAAPFVFTPLNKIDYERMTSVIIAALLLLSIVDTTLSVRDFLRERKQKKQLVSE